MMKTMQARADWLVKLSRGHWQGGSSTQGIDAGFPLIDYLASFKRMVDAHGFD